MNESTAVSTLPCVMPTVCFFPFLVLFLLENSSKICHENQADHIQPLPLSLVKIDILNLKGRDWDSDSQAVCSLLRPVDAFLYYVVYPATS